LLKSLLLISVGAQGFNPAKSQKKTEASGLLKSLLLFSVGAQGFSPANNLQIIKGL
jgi:hypothetical protein